MSNWGWEQDRQTVDINIIPTEIQVEIKTETETETEEKYLVYYTIGSDVKFIECLDLSIKSLRLFGKYNGDILIITDNICHEQVKEKFKDCNILHIDSDCINCESSINKLKIYTYENIKKYNKIIYLDLDVLVQNNIDEIFNSIKNKFIFSNEYLPHKQQIAKIGNDDGYGRLLFSEKEAFVYDIENRKSINGGFFGFDISLISHFEKILIDLEIDREISKSNSAWYCEQPTLNKYMITNDIYDDSISDKVLEFATQYSFTDIDIQNKILLHFCWGVGNHELKIKHMQQWYNYLLEKKTL
jgi:hypothetical protein